MLHQTLSEPMFARDSSSDAISDFHEKANIWAIGIRWRYQIWGMSEGCLPWHPFRPLADLLKHASKHSLKNNNVAHIQRRTAAIMNPKRKKSHTISIGVSGWYGGMSLSGKLRIPDSTKEIAKLTNEANIAARMNLPILLSSARL
jgi:hypothetical protein